MNKAIFMMALMALFFSYSGRSQGVTTGNISGIVLGDKQEAVAGASVLAIHTPSGSKYFTLTARDGHFLLRDVRVGGPYAIIVSNIGYDNDTLHLSRVDLGQDAWVSTVLRPAGQVLGAIVVRDRGRGILSPNKAGSGRIIDKSAIASLPTISRSLTDFTRLVPQAGAKGIAGKGSKSNTILIDGAAFNNYFGLGPETAAMPGANANAQPISLDAIEQVAVSVSPYDVKQGGFTGAAINAVTRSGDNDFRGSVYTFFRNEHFIGTHVKNTVLANTPFKENIYGFRLGGPVIKNRLFFFVNYEQVTSSEPGATYLAARPNLAGANISNISAANLDALSNYVQTVYHYQPGVYENYNLPTENRKFLIKLDWNIDTRNKLSVRYNQLNANTTFGASSMLNSIGYSNNGYIRYNDIYSITGELHSHLRRGWQNRLFLSYTSLPDFRQFEGSLFPIVVINDNGLTYQLGTNNAARDNRMVQHIAQVQDDISLSVGNHKLSAGVSYQYLDMANSFTLNPQGTFTFSSLAAFYNSSAAGTLTPVGASTGNGLPSAYSLNYTLLPGRATTYTHAKFSQTVFYAQDEWFPFSRLKLTAGVRLETMAFLTNPVDNPKIAALPLQGPTGQPESYSIGRNPAAIVQLSPRLGFNLDLSGDHTVQLRGGSGLFAGYIPFVYIASGYSMNGISEGAIVASNPTAASKYPFSPDVKAYVPANGGAPSSFEADLIAPHFKLPQSWRNTLALDLLLPGKIIASFEALYSRDLHAAYYRNANLNYTTAGTAADGRLQYQSSRINSSLTGAYVLDNTNLGHQLLLTASFNRSFAKHGAASVAYTYGNVQDAFTFRSTIASGAFNAIHVVGNSNIPVVSQGDFDLRHRLSGDVSYTFTYGKGRLSSTLGLFFEAAQQGHGSYTYSGIGDVNRDGAIGNDLIFVPRDPSQINLVATPAATAQQQWDALDAFISSSPYLSGRRGMFAERNGIILPWYFQADLKFAQDLSMLLRKSDGTGSTKHTLELTINILNVTNLLNKDWGVLKIISNPNPITALTPTKFTVNPAALQRGEFIQDNGLGSMLNPSASSRYRMQLGVRYSFN